MSTPPERLCIRIRIEGVVQGVGFRWWTQQTATDLGLDGWVRNRRDGGVEAVISGPRDVVDKMIALCRTGPRSARVDWVNVQPEDEAPAAGFTLRPTA